MHSNKHETKALLVGTAEWILGGVNGSAVLRFRVLCRLKFRLMFRFSMTSTYRVLEPVEAVNQIHENSNIIPSETVHFIWIEIFFHRWNIPFDYVFWLFSGVLNCGIQLCVVRDYREIRTWLNYRCINTDKPLTFSTIELCR